MKVNNKPNHTLGLSNRSLQLAERSPNRNRMHKSVVHINGNTGAPAKEKQFNRTTAITPNRRYVIPNVANVSNHNRLTVNTDRQYEKAHSLDTEYDKYANNVRTNFDKSHSLDESYGSEASKPKKYVEHPNYSQATNNSNSPQKYGNRLHNPEIIFERSRQSMLYSPLMYKREQPAQHLRTNSRDQPANLGIEPIYRTMAKSYDHLQTAVTGHRNATVAHSISPTKRVVKIPANTSPSSDYEFNASDFNVDYDMRRNVNNDRLGLYGGKSSESTAFANQRGRDTKKVSNKPAIAPSLSPSAVTASRYLRK